MAGDAYKDHDAVCGDIVENMASLGGFQVEFPVYLTCYADKGECYYYISSNKMDIYTFIDARLKEELYCIPPVRKSMRCIVSSGQKEDLYQMYKVTAAKEIMHEGAGDIARLLPKLAPKQTNEAYELMERLRIGLKGVFNTEKRQLYRGLLDMAYYSKKINGIYYIRMLEWLDIEEMQLEEECIVYTVHERVYCGFAYYKPDGSIGYYTNALQEATIAHREELMIAGTVVSPILMKRYGFNDISSISNVITDFKELLKKHMGTSFMRLVDEVYALPNINDGLLELELAQTDDKLKERALNYYKALWQL